MKKALTILLSLVMMITILANGCLAVFAQGPKTQWESRPNSQDAETYVNGYSGLISVYEDYDKEKDTLTFWVDDEYHVTGWEFPTLTENKQYEVVSEEGNSITIKWLTEDKNLPYINVLIDNLEEIQNNESIENGNSNGNNNKAENRTDQKSEKTNSYNQNTTENKTESTTKATTKDEYTTQETASTDLIQQSDNNFNKLIIPCVAVALACVIIASIVIKKKHNK